MTNLEIIASECALRGITEDVHTFTKWKSLGYSVKKGEHALFDTQLWKQGKGKSAEESEDGEEHQGHMFLHKAFLFGRSQVEEIKENNHEEK